MDTWVAFALIPLPLTVVSLPALNTDTDIVIHLILEGGHAVTGRHIPHRLGWSQQLTHIACASILAGLRRTLIYLYLTTISNPASRAGTQVPINQVLVTNRFNFM